MCPVFNGRGYTAVWMLRIKSHTKGMKERQMTYWLHLLVMLMISINFNSSR